MSRGKNIGGRGVKRTRVSFVEERKMGPVCLVPLRKNYREIVVSII